MSTSTDASRIAFVQVMPDDTKQSAVAFLNAAVTYYESLSVKTAALRSFGLLRCLPRPRPASHPHQAVYASHQWKGRTNSTGRSTGLVPLIIQSTS